MPCILFVDELLKAYPDAKIILTNRDIQSWLTSVDKTIFEIFSWKSFYFMAPLEPVCNPTSYASRCPLMRASANLRCRLALDPTGARLITL